MALTYESDSRPVNVGDLVAAQWFNDETFYIGEVEVELSSSSQIVKNIGGEGYVQDAYHVVKLMDADVWKRVLYDMSKATFTPLVEAFPMIDTGDYSPEDTFLFEEQLKMAAIKWLHWNYPKV